MNSLFFPSKKSLCILLSSFSCCNAGFKSITSCIFPSFKRFSTFLYLSKCADELNIVGPDTPKCVNSISPKSSYIVLFLFVSINFIWTFLRLKPCICLQIFKDSSSAVNGTSDGFTGTIVCPNFWAISYPSPVEPVAEYVFPPVARITLSAKIFFCPPLSSSYITLTTLFSFVSIPTTLVLNFIFTLLFFSSASNAFNTSSDLSEVGNILFPLSSFTLTPCSFKKLIISKFV